jgi:hypothetical protein
MVLLQRNILKSSTHSFLIMKNLAYKYAKIMSGKFIPHHVKKINKNMRKLINTANKSGLGYSD